MTNKLFYKKIHFYPTFYVYARERERGVIENVYKKCVYYHVPSISLGILIVLYLHVQWDKFEGAVPTTGHLTSFYKVSQILLLFYLSQMLEVKLFEDGGSRLEI